MGRLVGSHSRYVRDWGLVMYNSLHIESLKTALEQIKQGIAVFEEYCTEDCEHCPLYKADACGYHMEFVPTEKLNDAVLSNFVDFHERKE